MLGFHKSGNIFVDKKIHEINEKFKPMEVNTSMVVLCLMFLIKQHYVIDDCTIRVYQCVNVKVLMQK